MSGARLGSEFVAFHVWRVVNDDRLASRITLLNSFVPNLVWLPGQIAKLTDREGSTVQQTLQAVAHVIYRDAHVRHDVRNLVKKAWAMIPAPAIEVQPFEPAALNWFEPTETFYRTRATRLTSVIESLETLERGAVLPRRVVTTATRWAPQRFDQSPSSAKGAPQVVSPAWRIVGLTPRPNWSPADLASAL
jgi:hypothetical protein